MSQVSIVAPRLDAKPWGGRRLARFGLDLPSGPIGEALVTAGDAMVSRGFGTGQTLDDLIREDPVARSGELGLAAVGGRPIFPLLVKLIDASENLSIQVHPDDIAAEPAGKPGKTEAWYVLDSEPGAGLYVGLADDVDLATFSEQAAFLDGTSSRSMRFVAATPGETILIPAGTIHALGAGVIVYEIQQPSDITYRLDDWGRVDAAGNPREMHLEAGFAVSRPEFRPQPIDPVALEIPLGTESLLVACRYFALARLELPTGLAHRLGWPHGASVVTLLTGTAHIDGDPLIAGESAVIWAGSDVELIAGEYVTALVAWVPDLARDVVQPAQASGASQEAIEALAGDTHDIAIDQAAP